MSEENLLPEAMPMEVKLKHLESIQSVINRLATDSFCMKGWAAGPGLSPPGPAGKRRAH